MDAFKFVGITMAATKYLLQVHSTIHLVSIKLEQFSRIVRHAVVNNGSMYAHRVTPAENVVIDFECRKAIVVRVRTLGSLRDATADNFKHRKVTRFIEIKTTQQCAMGFATDYNYMLSLFRLLMCKPVPNPFAQVVARTTVPSPSLPLPYRIRCPNFHSRYTIHERTRRSENINFRRRRPLEPFPLFVSKHLLVTKIVAVQHPKDCIRPPKAIIKPRSGSWVGIGEQLVEQRLALLAIAQTTANPTVLVIAGKVVVVPHRKESHALKRAAIRRDLTLGHVQRPNNGWCRRIAATNLININTIAEEKCELRLSLHQPVPRQLLLFHRVAQSLGGTRALGAIKVLTRSHCKFEFRVHNRCQHKRAV
jgi:hypothetical protein